MKAALIRDYGGPDALVYEDVAAPVPQAYELLVAVEAVGMNPADYKFRRGDYKAVFSRAMPLILGMDVVGRVRALGRDVAGYTVGQRVLAMIPHTHTGGYAEELAAPAAWFAPMPDGLNPVAAAALPTPGTTGAELVEEDLSVGPGTRILVTGATGAVGLIACQAARQRGAHVIAGVRARYRDQVHAADEVLLMDEAAVLPQPPVDCIADTVGGAAANRLLAALKPGGVLGSVSTFPVGNIGGLDVVSRRFACRPDAGRLARLARALADGDLVLPPVQTLPLSKAAEAHRILEGGGTGKFVLLP